MALDELFTRLNEPARPTAVPNLRGQGRKHRLVKAAEALTLKQLGLILDTLASKAAIAVLKGEYYAVRRCEGGWHVQSFDNADDPAHTVTRDSCTCISFRTRKRCKHHSFILEVMT